MAAPPSSNGNAARPTNGSARVGVFVCHCGGNISDVVDVQRVADRWPATAWWSPPPTCSCVRIPGRRSSSRTIRDHGPEPGRGGGLLPDPAPADLPPHARRAPASTSTCSSTSTSASTCRGWWKTRSRRPARPAAWSAPRSARARHLVPLAKRRIPIHPAALVIGGGIAGLVAARDLAARGMDVTLRRAAAVPRRAHGPARTRCSPPAKRRASCS